MAKTFRVTLSSADGTPMFSGMLSAEEIVQIPPRSERQFERPAATNGQPDSGEKMTDPQKRYLFRLLGAQGIEGKKAEAHLCQYFGVNRISDIPKQAASTYIDQLVKDQKEVGNGGA